MNRNNDYLIGNQFAKGNKNIKTSFVKGHTPWNKDLKGIHLSPKSEFKKGSKPTNHVPVYTITERTDKHNKPRNHIKIAEPNKWVEYAKYLWEINYGKLIPGDVVHHLNGIHDDDWIDNLIALPRPDHTKFHGWWGIKQLTNEQLSFYRNRYKVAEKRLYPFKIVQKLF